MTITHQDLASVRETLESQLDAVGVSGFVHAVDIDSGMEVGLHSDTPAVAASVFKLPVLAELCRQYGQGLRSPVERINVPADYRRTDGPTGLSVMLDDVELSLRDLAFLMMSVSDNRATDIIVDLLGYEAINQTIGLFGLTHTAVVRDCAGLFETIREDLGNDYVKVVEAISAGGAQEELRTALKGTRAANATQTNHTTPREITSMLAAIWRDEVIGAEAAAEVRRILALQAWPHRLTAGFPDAQIKVAGKTGTLFYTRNEAGVVEFPDGGRYAVGVFLVEPTEETRNPDADRLIGTLARIAVDYLRSSQTESDAS